MSILDLFRFRWRAPQTESEKNAHVRAQLASYGDDGTSSRQTLHYAYPRQDTAIGADVIVGQLAPLGFETSPAEQGGGLVLEHETEVASARFDELTEELGRHFTAQGWEYDGWECAVAISDQGADQ